MSEPENRSHARIWLRYAAEDLEAAQELLDASVSPRHVCFLAQQSAEKAIKAVLVFLQVDFPKSHDLEALANLLPDDCRIRGLRAELPALTEWAIEARYPGNWPEASTADAENSIRTVKEVVSAAESDLESRGLGR